MRNSRDLEREQKLEAWNVFRVKHEQKEGGFMTSEIASEYARLKMDWWGSNLVFLGITEKDGLFYPGFNVFD